MLRLILMSRPAWLSYGFYLLNSVLPKDNADRYSPELHLGRRMLLAFIPFFTLCCLLIPAIKSSSIVRIVLT